MPINPYNLVKKCPYCNSKVNYVDSKVIYNKSYGMIYLCSNYPKCEAFVGVHKGTDKPLGRLANKSLREYKKKAHKYFDYLWKYKQHFFKDKNARSKAYKWLSKQLGIDFQDTHIGYFDESQCKMVIELCKPIYIKLLANTQ